MTKRKPSGLRWESWIDRQVRQARDEGAFDDLPGHGQPDPTLGEVRDPLWWGKKMLEREGLAVTPPAFELKRHVERELDALDELSEEARVRERLARLNARIRRANATVTSGPPTQIAPLDEEAAIERWRARRSGKHER